MKDRIVARQLDGRTELLFSLPKALGVRLADGQQRFSLVGVRVRFVGIVGRGGDGPVATVERILEISLTGVGCRQPDETLEARIAG